MSDADKAETVNQAARLVAKAKKLFAGQGSAVTGAALCELVALHLAGHVCPEDAAETRRMRAELLEAFVRTVERLTPVLEITEILPRLAEMKSRQRPN